MMDYPDNRGEAFWSITLPIAYFSTMIWIEIVALRYVGQLPDGEVAPPRALLVPFALASVLGLTNITSAALRKRRSASNPVAAKEPAQTTGWGPIGLMLGIQKHAAQLLGLPPLPIQVVQALLVLTFTLLFGALFTGPLWL